MADARVALDAYLGLAPVMQSTPKAVRAQELQSPGFVKQSVASPSSSTTSSSSIFAAPHIPSDREAIRTASLLSRPLARDVELPRRPSRPLGEAAIEQILLQQQTAQQALSASNQKHNRAAALRHITKALDIIEHADELSSRAARHLGMSSPPAQATAAKSNEESLKLVGNTRPQYHTKGLTDPYPDND